MDKPSLQEQEPSLQEQVLPIRHNPSSVERLFIVWSCVMPAKSKAQQQAAGIALAAKEGKKDVDDLKGPAKSMHDSMSKKELHDLAATKTHNKPDHASDKQ